MWGRQITLVKHRAHKVLTMNSCLCVYSSFTTFMMCITNNLSISCSTAKTFIQNVFSCHFALYISNFLPLYKPEANVYWAVPTTYTPDLPVSPQDKDSLIITISSMRKIRLHKVHVSISNCKYMVFVNNIVKEALLPSHKYCKIVLTPMTTPCWELGSPWFVRLWLCSLGGLLFNCLCVLSWTRKKIIFISCPGQGGRLY